MYEDVIRVLGKKINLEGDQAGAAMTVFIQGGRNGVELKVSKREDRCLVASVRVSR